jgi:uncharacterized protein (DUF2147 family)
MPLLHITPSKLGRCFALSVLALAATATHAASPSPVGLWKTVDDKTGEARSHVRISDAAGLLTGRIELILELDKRDAKCTACSGPKKNQPITGMTILEGVRRSRSADHWEGGSILDPNDGKVYRVRLTPQRDGRTLEVRGYLGPFYRNQYWVRVD